MQAIRAQLPHRPPLLLLDRILEREPGVRVVAEKLVTCGDPILQGHFPGRPIVPGVMLVEMLAQAAAFLEAEALGDGPIFLAKILDARFKASAFPGDRLELTVKPDAAFGRLRRVEGSVRCEGRVLCTAKLLLAKGEAVS